MPRTILNWSELLNQYHLKCYQENKRMRKWSELSQPEPKPVPEIIEIDPKTGSTHESFSELKNKPSQIRELPEKPETFKPSKESKETLEKEPLKDQNDSVNEKPRVKNDLPDPKSKKETLSKLFYDRMMMDSESIPAMVGSDCLKQKIDFEPEKITERESFLLELLEVYLENQ